MDIFEKKGLVYILNRWCRVVGKVNCETSDWRPTKQTLYTSAFWSFIDDYLTDINSSCTISRKFDGIKKRDALRIFSFEAVTNECEFLARLTYLNTIWSINVNFGRTWRKCWRGRDSCPCPWIIPATVLYAHKFKGKKRRPWAILIASLMSKCDSY